jgi:hypothetical protein
MSLIFRENFNFRLVEFGVRSYRKKAEIRGQVQRIKQFSDEGLVGFELTLIENC